jgi:hypothetical protein
MALEDLARYESAAIAAINSEKEKDIAVLAMKDYYHNIGMSEDPIVHNALEQAFAGTKSGNITNLDVVNAIGVYHKKYEEAFMSTKVSDLTKYLTEGFDISAEAKNALEKYKDLTLVDLGKKAKENPNMTKEEKTEISNLMQTVEILKERRLRAKTLGIYNKAVKQDIEQMYPKKKEGEKK